MNNINIPKDLLSNYGIDYDSLPETINKDILNKEQKILFKYVTILSNVATNSTPFYIAKFFSLLFSEKIIKNASYKEQKKYGGLTPLAKERLKETEEKVQLIAKEMGIKNPQKIKVYVNDNLRIGGSASGKSILQISPDILFKPSDLPLNLSFERLDNQEISEEEWAFQFDLWCTQNIFNKKINKQVMCQEDIDRKIIEGKEFLKIYRNQNEFKKVFEGIIGHELGHLKYNHTYKGALHHLFFAALQIATLGISTFIQNKAMNKIHRRKEIEADLFCQKKIGSEGLINLFKHCSEAGKTLHEKYPQIYDEKGGFKKDHDHPHDCDRIKYLKMMDNVDGTTNAKRLRKKIKKKYA